MDTSHLEQELDMLEVCAAAAAAYAEDDTHPSSTTTAAAGEQPAQQQQQQEKTCSPFTIAPLGLYMTTDAAKGSRALHFLLEYAPHGDVQQLVRLRRQQLLQWLDLPAPAQQHAERTSASCSPTKTADGGLLLFSEGEMRFLAACLLQGAACVHGCGIAHRDLKPCNLRQGLPAHWTLWAGELTIVQ